MKRGVIIGIIAGVVIILAGVVLLLSGRKPAAPTKATLTVWSPFDESAVYQKISQKWLAANPTVTLDFKYVAAADAKDYEAQVVNAIAGGQGPDIWLVRSDWLPKHTDKSAPATLNGSSAAAITQVKANVIPNLVDLNTVDGKLYGMPLSADALALIYNQTLYDSITGEMTGDSQKIAETVPASWDDLKSQVALISQAKNGIVTRSGLALGTASNTLAAADVLSAFLVENGVSSVLSQDGKSVSFNLPGAVGQAPTLPATDTVSFYTSFSNPAAPNFSWTENLGDPVQAFTNQKTVALVGYYSTLQTILDKNPTFTVSVLPLVQPHPSNSHPRIDYGVTWSGVVNKASRQTALAWNYLAYLGAPAILQQYATATNRLNISNEGATASLTAQSAYVNSSGAADLFEKELGTAMSLTTPEWQFTSQVLQDTINLVIHSGQSAQTAVDSAAARFKTQFLGGQ